MLITYKTFTRTYERGGQRVREMVVRWYLFGFIPVYARRYELWRKASPISDGLRSAVLTADKWTCVYCGSTQRESLQLDYRTPAELGGASVFDNLVTACESCLEKKRGKTPEEAGMPCIAGRFVKAKARQKQKPATQRSKAAAQTNPLPAPATPTPDTRVQAASQFNGQQPTPASGPVPQQPPVSAPSADPHGDAPGTDDPLLPKRLRTRSPQPQPAAAVPTTAMDEAAEQDQPAQGHATPAPTPAPTNGGHTDGAGQPHPRRLRTRPAFHPAVAFLSATNRDNDHLISQEAQPPQHAAPFIPATQPPAVDGGAQHRSKRARIKPLRQPSPSLPASDEDEGEAGPG